MKELTSTQKRELEEQLLALRGKLEAQLRRSLESAKPVDLGAPIGRLSRVDALQQQQMARSQRARDESTLNLVSTALSKIRVGDYGVCLKCEEPIGYGRLRARPEAPLCLDCRAGMG